MQPFEVAIEYPEGNPMRLIKVDRGGAEVELTESELGIFNNALNEVCNGIDVPEFATRIGAEVAEVRLLLKDVNDILGHHALRQKPLP